MKSKADNIRLFDEAHSLRVSVRSTLHDKATNRSPGRVSEQQSGVTSIKSRQNGTKSGS
jgi:hypothetical protein